MSPTPQGAVAATCAVMGGRPEDVLVPQRGNPAAALRRWVSMWAWMELTDPRPSYAAAGRAFDRDRTSVRHGLKRLREVTEADLVMGETLRQVLDKLRADPA